MSGEVSVLSRRARATPVGRWVHQHSAERHIEGLVFAGFFVAIVATGFAMVRWPSIFLPATLAPWVVLAALFLEERWHLLVIFGVATTFLAAVLLHLVPGASTSEVAFLGMLALMATMYVLAASRARLGIRGLTGETLLVDLRERLQRGSQIPALPAGWTAQFAIRSAHGDSFAGDFLVTALSEDESVLEVVLVDVSGKGRQAGSRSLHLSGALSGLLGSVAPDAFLSAANAYLVRQRWDEGFATAIHLTVDLRTGAYAVGRAGHPPAAQFRLGSGEWRIDRSAHGPLLGVVPDARYERSHSQLCVGDALMLYSDGVIESPGRDLIDGVDRMFGVAARALVHNALTVAEDVVAAAPSGTSDDRAVFFIRRG